MAKKTVAMILAVLFFIVSIVNVLAVGNLNIIESSLSLSGNAGQIVVGNFSVQNLGNSTMNAVLLASTSLAGGRATIPASAIQVVPAPLNLNAGASTKASVLVTVPSLQFAQTYTGTLSATFDGSNNDNLPFTLSVNPSPAASVIANTPLIVQGNSGQVVVTVKNTGNTDLVNLPYKLSTTLTKGLDTLAALEAASGTVTVGYVSPTTAGQTTVPFTFVVPANKPAGTYSGELNVTVGTSTVSQIVSLVVVTQNKALATSNTPGAVKIDRVSNALFSTTPLKITLTNTGNVNLQTVTITKAALTNGLGQSISDTSLALSDNSFSMGPGEVRVIDVTPTVTASQATGTYTGAFSVAFGGIQPTNVNVQVVVSDAVSSVLLPEVQFDQSEREVTLGKTVQITNNGAFTLSGISMTTSAPNTTLSGVPTTLAPGAVATVTITTFVPKNRDAGLKQFGTMTFTSDKVTVTAALKTNAISKLRFDKIQVALGDGRFDTVSTSGNSVSDDVKPHDKFETKAVLENLFSAGSKIRIKDVKIDAVFKGVGDDGDDIDGEAEEFDIDEDEKSNAVTIDWDTNTIDKKAENGDHEMVLTAEGKDENGALHRATFTVKVKVDRDNGVDAVLTKLFVSPTTVECGESFVLNVDGENRGEKSDKHAALELVSAALSVNTKKEFELGDYKDDDCDAIEKPDKSCNEFSYDQTFNVPSSVQSGTYAIKARFLYDTTKEGASKTVTLVVSCGLPATKAAAFSSAGLTGTPASTSSTGGGAQSSQAAMKTAPMDLTTTPTTTGATTGGTKSSNVEVLFNSPTASVPSVGAVAKEPVHITDLSTQKRFTDSTAFLMLLALANLAAVALILGLLTHLMRR